MSDLTKATPFRDRPKYDENPFMDKLPALMAGKISNKINGVITQDVDIMKKNTDSLYAKDNESLLAAKTKVVDRATFVKVYTDTIQMMTGMSSKAIKVFYWYVVDNLQKERTDIDFNLDICMEVTQLSKPTVYAALSELVEHDLIARTRHTWIFYINPNAIFNGNRIRVVNDYLREGSAAAKAMRAQDSRYNEPEEMTEEPEPKQLKPEDGDDSDW